MVPANYHNHEKGEKGQVVAYRCKRSADGISQHEWETHLRLAERLAVLMGYEFAGEYDPQQSYGHLYFVPNSTLLHADAQRLGIWREQDLFGGCVAAPFAGTKSITHPLVGPDATAPAGWSDAFPRAVADAVLQGFSVFSHTDARTALQRLQKGGTVRLKPALGVGGTGQVVIGSPAELDDALLKMDAMELARYGVVLERNLNQVATYSVGQVRCNDICISYHGTQRLTTNRQGESVYGGSTLRVVRGDYKALRRLPLTTPLRLAIDQACRYDHAATNYLGLLASRRNYDVAQGLDGDGRLCSGVLEQSWRIGGASPAEIAALEAFNADDQLHSVQVSTHEVHREAQCPPHACVHFRGVDPDTGPITKYCTIDAYEYSTAPA